MKKLIMLLLCLFTMIPGIAGAKEYTFKEYNFSINIPDNYIAATRDNIPTELTKVLGLSREKLREQLFPNAKNILYFVNFDDGMEFSVVRTEDQFSEKMGDMTKYKNEFTPDKIRNTKTFASGLMDLKFHNVDKYDTPNAYYIVVDGEREINGLKPTAKFYWTVKNYANFHIVGLSYSHDKVRLNRMLLNMVNSVRYDAGVTKVAPAAKPQPVASNSSSYSSRHRGDPWMRGISKGILSGLFLGLCYLGQWLWHKFKGKKGDEDTVEANPEDKSTEELAKEIEENLENNSRSDAAEEIMKYKKLLDAGAITQEEFEAKKKQLLNL